MPGAPTARDFRQLQDQVRDLERRIANIPARWTPPSYGAAGYWALLTVATEISANRWGYDFAQAYLGDDDVWYTLTNGRTGTIDDGTHALNIREMLNDTSGQQGNGVTPSLLNSGQQIVASVIAYPVWMVDVRKPDGSIRAMFYDQNGVDGACE